VSEELDKDKEVMAEAKAEAMKLLNGVSGLRQAAASLLAGFAVGNAAVFRIQEQLEKFVVDENRRQLVKMHILDLVQLQAGNMPLETVRKLLMTEVHPLLESFKPEKKAKKDGPTKVKVMTGVPLLDQAKSTGLEGGRVLVIQGVRAATSEFARWLANGVQRQGYEVVHMYLEEGDKYTGSQVSLRQPAWWSGGLSDWSMEKDVFSSASLTRNGVVFIDDLLRLGVGSGSESTSYGAELLRRLRRAAKRVHLPVVVQWPHAEGGQPEVVPTAQGRVTSVVAVLRDGVLTVDGERVERGI
jgi:hypothetical protein